MSRPSVDAERPSAEEYAPFYETYIGRLADGPITPRLAAQSETLRSMFAGLSEDGPGYRYAPGKWSVREVLGHLCDTERLFGTRAVCIARGDTTPLPGFDENRYVEQGNFESRPVESLLREFEMLRAANLEFVGSLAREAWKRCGTANGTPLSVRAAVWILAGHLEHHMAVLKERYAAAFSG